MEMREERNLTLTQIAAAVGFSSLQHFSSCYKQRMGVSPSVQQPREKGKG
jgi:transcriptional regulator GlxA family with amidase domain